MIKKFKEIVFVIVLIFCLAPVMYADWVPSDGHKMHFPQLPDPIGWDVDLKTYWLADDWQCSGSGPVTDIHFWISWRYDSVGTIPQFMVQIWDNDANVPSKPKTMLWSRTFLPEQFVIRPDPNYGDQGYWIPSPTNPVYERPNHQMYFQVNMKDITDPFVQEEGKIYWLAIKVPPTTPYYPGWKTSQNHFMDAAVVKYPAGWTPLYDPYETGPIDFSFVITGSTPEPEPKWLQRPDLSTNGLDVMATDPVILADDFECNKTTLITDITVWGSWKDDYLPYGYDPNAVTFTLSIHSDIPDPDPLDPASWSMPGDTLWVKNVKASEFAIEKENINEGWYDPYYSEYYFPGDHVCWKYTFRIPEADAFCQEGTTNNPIVYWLDVQAHPYDTSARFGWKSSINHWNDDATLTTGMEPLPSGQWWYELRYPYGHQLEGNSIDLAFAIDGNIPCTQPDNEDFGDAPDGIAGAAYQTLLINNGARHIIDGITFMGALVDAEGNGQPTANADGDDLNPLAGPDDEDGVVIPVLKQGKTATIQITASPAGGLLDAWIDYGADNSWAEAGDQIAASLPLGGGLNVLAVTVPASATAGQTYARFRISTAGGLPSFGPAPDGEVEDYSVTIIDPNTKYLQRPDTSEYGIDIHFDRNDGIARTLADDFLCTSTGKITDVHLWCSWLNDIKGTVDKIHLSIHDDIPASVSPTGYSTPGNLLWQRDFNSAEFNETLFYTLPLPQHEWWFDPYMYIVNPMGDTQIWRYDINIPYTQAFRQEGNETNPKVYWLDAWVMLSPDSPPEAEMGWKTSIDHWNDAAVYEDPTGFGWIKLLYPYNEADVDMAFAITTMPDCLKSTATGYAAWVNFGRPDCWCYQRQCRGDINGKKAGLFWVQLTDLNALKAAYGKTDAQLALITNGICADLNHLKAGQFRVQLTDLNILKSYYGKVEGSVPICDVTTVNFWTN